MRNTLMVTAAIALALGSAPAFAQQSPAAPNASSGTVQSPNSVPGGQVSQPPGAGGNLGGQVIAPAPAPYAAGQPGVNAVRPMRTRRPVRPVRHRAPVVAPATSSDAGPAMGAPMTADGARPGNIPGTGNSLPTSNSASNITARDTRSAIAPRLPTPNATGTTVSFLQAADRDLAANRTGAAQEALERAETRALDRSVEQSAASTPDNSALVSQIGDARRALASGNTAGARSSVQSAMAAAR